MDSKLFRLASRLSSSALTLLALIGGGYWLGAKLDIQFNTAPLLLITLTLLGSILGVGWFIYIIVNWK